MKLDEKQKLDTYKSGYQSFIFVMFLFSLNIFFGRTEFWNTWFPDNMYTIIVFTLSNVFFSILIFWRNAIPSQNNEKLFRKGIALLFALLIFIILLMMFYLDTFIILENGSTVLNLPPFILLISIICYLLALIIRYFLNKKDDL